MTADLTVEECRSLVRDVVAHRDRFFEGLADLHRQRVHVILGYRSFARFVAQELGSVVPPKLPKASRRAVVRDLAATGMSGHDVAAVTGLARETVRRDLGTAPSSAEAAAAKARKAEPPKPAPAPMPAVVPDAIDDPLADLAFRRSWGSLVRRFEELTKCIDRSAERVVVTPRFSPEQRQAMAQVVADLDRLEASVEVLTANLRSRRVA
ncbi:hypothetical protein [Amycolatopsis sp. H20-H5]|uniref:hypothetical protein n=1 Tax=Amycolatopsis sp. H20-H5 TaxID=3046309 RepID=UPI002DBE79ED|nr:hypothetical protein [Amycolatopsis sp. H20-H5]MEC3974754.1 hypothetical protein [Amycolatopsis sp. H20-H5]